MALPARENSNNRACEWAGEESMGCCSCSECLQAQLLIECVFKWRTIRVGQFLHDRVLSSLWQPWRDRIATSHLLVMGVPARDEAAYGDRAAQRQCSAVMAVTVYVERVRWVHSTDHIFSHVDSETQCKGRVSDSNRGVVCIA